MSFLCRVAERSLRDRVRSSITREELGVEPLLLYIEWSQLSWLGHLFQMPPGRLPLEVFPTCPAGRRPEEDPGHAGVTMSLDWPGNALGSSWKSWGKCPGRGKSRCPCSGSCPCDLAPDNAEDDGWMDEWMDIFDTYYSYSYCRMFFLYILSYFN